MRRASRTSRGIRVTLAGLTNISAARAVRRYSSPLPNPISVEQTWNEGADDAYGIVYSIIYKKE
jgi:hypothetical protein